MAILITGSAGFIGSHLVEYWLKQGESIIGFDNLNSFYDPAIKQQNMAAARHHTQFQFIEGDKYKDLAEKKTTKNFIIPANRGNLYDANGNLLATSVPKYDIRFDAVTVKQDVFEANVNDLSQELSKLFGKPASYYSTNLRKARANKNRYYLVASNLGY